MDLPEAPPEPASPSRPCLCACRSDRRPEILSPRPVARSRCRPEREQNTAQRIGVDVTIDTNTALARKPNDHYPVAALSTAQSRRLRHDLHRDKGRCRRCHRHQRQLATPGQLPPRVEKTCRDPVATRDLRWRSARPKGLGHQRQLLLAGPTTPPFGLRQDLGHQFYGHLKRGRKDLFIGQRRLTAKLYLADEIRKAAGVRRLRRNGTSLRCARSTSFSSAR